MKQLPIKHFSGVCEIAFCGLSECLMNLLRAHPVRCSCRFPRRSFLVFQFPSGNNEGSLRLATGSIEASNPIFQDFWFDLQEAEFGVAFRCDFVFKRHSRPVRNSLYLICTFRADRYAEGDRHQTDLFHIASYSSALWKFGWNSMKNLLWKRKKFWVEQNLKN